MVLYEETEDLAKRVINLLPQQSVGLHFLPLLRSIFSGFSLRTHLFSKMIQQTH